MRTNPNTSSSVPAAPAPKPAPNAPLRSLAVRALDALTSVRLGILLMVILFVYISLGSGLPQLRQLPILEMTEMEWFAWWPFLATVGLLCINMAVVTFRRIPFTRINLGVWMIHTGIVTLCVGSVVYFTVKVEGDAPLIRRAVSITAADGQHLHLPALPGASGTLAHPDGTQTRYQVVSADPAWPLLSGDDTGAEAFSVTVAVSPPAAGPHASESFQRQLLDGYPQYTEDIIPGVGRAVHARGARLVDTALSIELTLEPARYRYLSVGPGAFTKALYVRPVGAPTWAQRPLRGLPRYNDYVSEAGGIRATRADRVIRRKLEIPATQGADDPLSGVSVRVTDYLRYAETRTERVPAPAGQPGEFAATVVWSDGESDTRHTLIAGADTNPPLLGIAWIDDELTPASVAAALPRTPGLLRVRTGSIAHGAAPPVTIDTGSYGPDAPMHRIDGTYSVRVLRTADGLRIGDKTISAAMLEVHRSTVDGSPEVFHRTVFDAPGLTRDASAHDEGAALPLDPDLTTLYTPGAGPAPVTIVGGPDGRLAAALFDSERPEPTLLPVAIGKRLQLSPSTSLLLSAAIERSVERVIPRVVPRKQRSREIGERSSMVRAKVSVGAWSQSVWLAFHEYAMPSAAYGYAGRILYMPTRVALPDGREIELLFSRQRRALPTPIALDDFHLHEHVGGFTGDAATVSDWVSEVVFDQSMTDSAAGPWSAPRPVRPNNPAQVDGLRYFQQSWDPPRPSVREPGLLYSGIGIANRAGVLTQLIGSTLATLGMLYAFYAKPILQRRAAAAVQAQLGAQPAVAGALSAEASS